VNGDEKVVMTDGKQTITYSDGKALSFKLVQDKK
jgi:hypothetical protein